MELASGQLFVDRFRIVRELSRTPEKLVYAAFDEMRVREVRLELHLSADAAPSFGEFPSVMGDEPVRWFAFEEEPARSTRDRILDRRREFQDQLDIEPPRGPISPRICLQPQGPSVCLSPAGGYGPQVCLSPARPPARRAGGVGWIVAGVVLGIVSAALLLKLFLH